jgi:uncharacterized protein (TIGR03437 family)
VPAVGTNAEAVLAPHVFIGGREAAVRSARLAHDMVGVYRVTVQVPGGLSAGNLPVEIEQDGVVSNRASIAVGP